jgi:biotin operon repressor
MNRVDRLLGYLLFLQLRGQVRAADFARRFEISERTVYRDVQALSEVGVPIVALPGKGYQLTEGYWLENHAGLSRRPATGGEEGDTPYFNVSISLRALSNLSTSGVSSDDVGP